MRDVVFVYLGEKVPKYVDASLRLAQKFSGLGVTFIAQGSLSSRFNRRGIKFVEIEKFYNPQLFENAKNNVQLNHDFRSGFWLKTLERLFVLKQFMIFESRSSIFHAELDQLIFRADRLLDGIVTTGLKGVFYPLHSAEKAVASVLYSNDINALSSILDLASNGPSFANEMELLSSWALTFPNKFIALPTLNEVLLEREGIFEKPIHKSINYKSLGGIVDASELGLWVAGRDPRNLALNEKPATKFTYPITYASLTTNSLKNLKFNFNTVENELIIKSEDTNISIRVFNLHIQSKIHEWLLKDQSHILLMFVQANNTYKFSFPGTRWIQVQYALGIILNRVRREKISYVYTKLVELVKYLISISNR